MLSALKSIGYRFQRNPLRVSLILLTVAIGVAVLALSLSVSFQIAALISRVLPSNGHVVSVTNGTLAADGTLDRIGSPMLSLADLAALGAEYPRLSDLTPISPAMGGTLRVDGVVYQPRDGRGVGPAYASLMRLSMAAGTFFSDADVEDHAAVVVISESVARIVFGSAEKALGRQMFDQATMVIVRMGAGQAEPLQQTTVSETPYTVVGVYRDLPEVVRKAFGVGDLLVPYTAWIPKGVDMPGVIMSFMARVAEDSVPVARAKVTDILKKTHGADFAVALWEGNPDSPDTVLSDARDSLTRFSVFLSGLGVLVLIVSCFGIFSIMMVEVIDKGREIGLRRALGSTERGIVSLLAGQAAVLALVGALIGLAAAAFLRVPLVSALDPYLETAGVRAGDLSAGASWLPAFLVAATAAVVAGGILSLFPATLAARRPIVECLREE